MSERRIFAFFVVRCLVVVVLLSRANNYFLVRAPSDQVNEDARQAKAVKFDAVALHLKTVSNLSKSYDDIIYTLFLLLSASIDRVIPVRRNKQKNTNGLFSIFLS